MICVKFMFFCDLQADLRVVWPPFASPYASSGFANLGRLASTCESVWPGLKVCLISYFPESSATKAVNHSAVPVLLQMSCDWQRTDHHNRQTGVRKSILTVLKNITMTSKTDPCVIQFFLNTIIVSHIYMTERIAWLG